MRKIFSAILVAICLVSSVPTFSACQEKVKGHSRYEINAEYVPESKTLTGTVKLTFENDLDSVIEALKFQIYPNAYRKEALYKPVPALYEATAYYAGESYGEMTISSVYGSKNWEVTGEDENVLYVYLERPLYPGDEIVLDIGFMTKLANVNDRTGITKRAVNLGNFFPILCGIKDGGFVESVYYSNGNPFFSECADYKVSLTTPKDYEVVSTGVLIEERTLESKKVHTMSATNVRDFAIILGESLYTKSVRSGKTTLSYCYYADETPQKTLDLIAESFSFYEETFGEYPYPAYTIAQTGLCRDSVAYPCLSFLKEGLTNEENSRAIAGEVARQWWYATVGSDSLNEAWQSEGLAEYSALTFFERYPKYEFTRDGIIKEALKEYRSYYDAYGSVLGRTDTRMTRNLKEYVSDYEYICLSRYKPLIMFDTMRKSVGDEKFFSALTRYYKAHALKIATMGDLVGCFEKTGLDVSGFFESFLEGKAIL